VSSTGPTLYVVACGAEPTREVARLVRHAQATGWVTCVVATRIGRRFLDVDALAALTGFPVREDYKQPDEPDVLPPADAVVCAPATFNTVNKLAAGISDTLPLGLVNEAIGGGLPVVLAPWTNAALGGHPAFARSVAALAEAGVRFVPQAGEAFDWPAVEAAVDAAHAELIGSPRATPADPSR
jgi:phosphopantothenoylcysteine synthetase/decarboxylase